MNYREIAQLHCSCIAANFGTKIVKGVHKLQYLLLTNYNLVSMQKSLDI